MLESLWRRTQDETVSGPSWAVARAALWGLVPLFHGASLAKRALFACCPPLRTRLPALTVSIGNLTMGGSGKTTMTRLLAGLLSEDLGLRTVALSRGYRSSNRAAILPVSRDGALAVGPDACGDEAWLLARWLTGCSVVVGKRRAVTGLWAVERMAEQAVLLDDGLQYWRLERDVDVLMVAVPSGFGNGLPFTRGPLREPLWGLERATCVVFHQADSADAGALERLQSLVAARAPGVPTLVVDVVPEPLRRAAVVRDGSVVGEADGPAIEGLRVFAFCGLGSPGSFRRTLEGAGATVVGMSAFPDHHVHGADDVRAVRSAAEAAGAEALVTTEKDEANLTTLGDDGLPMFVLPVRGVFRGDGRVTMLEILRRAVP